MLSLRAKGAGNLIGQWRASTMVRNPTLRYLALAVLAVVILVAALAPLTTILVEGWSRRDIESRARLVFHSVRDQVTMALATEPPQNLTPYFERLAEDERLLGLAYCTPAGSIAGATKLFPKSLTCQDLPLASVDRTLTLESGDRHVHISVFPFKFADSTGHLLVVHDMSFVESRTRKFRIYSTLSLLGIAAGIGLLASVLVLVLLRNWTRTVRAAIADGQAGGAAPPAGRNTLPIAHEIQSLLAELRVERKYTEGIQVEWSPRTLHQLLTEDLPGANVLVVSNREPYIHNRTDHGITLQIPASGLVAALEPVMRACGGTWVAHGSGSADRDTVDAHDRLAVPPADPSYTLRRVWLNEEDQDGYYYGFSNEGLWPLCHIAFVRPTFRETDWQSYRSVNERFADVVVEEAGCEDPIVLVQDYHFGLLPRLIRDRLPRATIITFWHIPWPNSETFSICPWREEIIDGLLGSTILGFHTQFHCNNFFEAVDRFVESRIDRERSSITVGGHETLIRPYPISIEWPPEAMKGQPSVAECRAAVVSRLGLPQDARIAVGIERFDYTKGILDRIRAVDDLLTREPEWIGKLYFVQAAAPTRSKLGTYATLQAEAERMAEEVNERHGNAGYNPIRLVVRHHDPSEVYELFRAADLCIVSSLHDGMNLVAKEFVASRDDFHGVLLLSSFAGASRELSEALSVNPYDTHAMAHAIGRALRMPADEQRERLRLMRDLVRQRNVYRWAAQMLLDTARVRRRARLLQVSGRDE